MGKKLSFRTYLSIITFLLIALILFLSRDEIVHAWELLGKLDLRVVALLLPVIALGYLASGEIIFSYLRQKGFVCNVSPFKLARMSLELNFANHALPSGGISGMSYMNWRLSKLGVPTGRSMVAQIVRYVTGFFAIVLLLMISVVLVTIDGNINRWIILMSSVLVFLSFGLAFFAVHMLSSKRRLDRLAKFVVKVVGRFDKKSKNSEAKKREESIIKFFDDMHDDYQELRRDKKLLIRPFIWSIIFTILDILPFWLTFYALGMTVNPAPILIAYGIATIAGVVVVTPGGAGAYEAIMVGVLALAGVSGGQAIAGIVFYRVLALLTALVLGYVFYQLTIMRSGKRTDTEIQCQ